MRKEFPIIPNNILSLLKQTFSEKQILSAQRLLQLSQIAISFKKGHPQRYFIVSGIVKDDKSYETRLTYKNDQEAEGSGSESRPASGEMAGQLKSLCNCTLWTNEHHCHHVTALFIKYYLQNLIGRPTHLENPTVVASGPGVSSAPETLAPTLLFSSLGVHVQEYGTIIEGPYKLLGASSSTSYSHQQYLLDDYKTVIPFPSPQSFTGILRLALYLDFSPSAPESSVLKRTFQYIDEEGQIHYKISLLENLYLLNWHTGTVYLLTDEIKNLINKINGKFQELLVDDFMRLVHPILNHSHFQLTYEDRDVRHLPLTTAHCKIFIDSDEKKNTHVLQVAFFDERDLPLPAPHSLSLFAFDNALLSTFRKKSDALDFLKALYDSMLDGSFLYQPFMRLSYRREKLEEQLQDFLSADSESILHHPTMSICHYENHLMRNLFKALYECFGQFFFRTSSYRPQDLLTTYEVNSSSFLQNISKFHSLVHLYGIHIFYNKMPVLHWNNHIKVGRTQGPLDWFDLSIEIPNIDFDFLNNLDPSESYSITPDGLVLLTPAQKKLVKFIKRYMNLKDHPPEEVDEEKMKKYVVPFNRARIFELFELHKMGIEGALTPDELSFCHQLLTLTEMPNYEIPAIADAQPRNYQVVGYQWLRFLFENKLGACLADDMGLGKTLQTIMFIKSVMPRIQSVLIVCPVSIIINWQNEFQKFTDLPVSIYYGGDRVFIADAPIILTSYGVMKKEAETTFKDIRFDILVLDEVQNLKNIKSLGAIAARKLKANFRICLTGTPLENHLVEFYNILDLSIPGIWGNLHLSKNLTHEDDLYWAKKTARPFILRRTKTQVLTDLPEKINNMVLLGLSDEERRNYQHSLQEIRLKIQGSPVQRRYGEILKGLLELRKLCLWQKTDQILSTKIKFLMENLDQILDEGHQAIVFSQFTTYLDIIQKSVEEKNWKYSRIDGGQSIQKRQKQVEQFQSGQTKLFLISLKAGGVGLNLTAASYVFLMDPWWNPAVESQAIDRAHRIGQKNKLTVYRPIIKDSVEEKVLTLQKIKKDLFDDLLNDHDEQYFTGKLTMEDFESLFS